ncbi:DUF58 domain-containing protein [Endozoicomonas sp. OPT23]|uniref:DUF58 domain-containing protein n=1 Tax=Endozoicomonas sp. OPT23 TaxID=2072845 RepID=UPI00129B5E46|nr:DUF58 domain-containing protein [Endozoicomonas sp. OPT23]MRI35256.1 DUF58 domain-containing protein [Endozoicomonas sp. OPT23]
MSGAYSELKELVNLRFAARDLALFNRKNARSLLAGTGNSPFKGRGIDFEEVRAYQHGDDIRSIDWRVTARRMKPHTKLFREERERPVMLLLDQSSSLFFGSRLNFKSVTAAETGAMIAWATLQHNDRIGGLIFSQNNISEIRPKRSKKTLLHLLNKLEEHNQALKPDNLPSSTEDNYLCKSLRHARRVCHPGTSVFIISDFSQMNDEAFRHMSRLSRKCELVAIHVSDPLEAELPRPGRYDITNGVHRKTIDTHSRQARQRYQQDFQSNLEELKQQFSGLRVPFVELSAAESTIEQMQANFNVRRKP